MIKHKKHKMLINKIRIIINIHILNTPIAIYINRKCIPNEHTSTIPYDESNEKKIPFDKT